LTTIEQNGAVVKTSDCQLTRISKDFFGKDNIKILHRNSKYLVIGYDARNGTFYDYLLQILEQFPKCWLKNEYSDENGNAGIFIARFIDGKVGVQVCEWNELTVEEIIHCEDFSLNTEKTEKA
jgi:hypothetical protein